jgi:hypothetical protein
MRRYTLRFAVVICSGLWTPLVAQTRHFVVDSAWVPTRIDQPVGGPGGPEDQGPNVLSFKNGRRLVVNLFDVQFLGQLPRPHGPPYLLLEARGCHSCDIETQVFIVAPDGDSLRQGPGAYGFAGTLRSGEPDDTVVSYRARLFIGQCLNDRQAIALWFQSERNDAGRWRSGVYRLGVVGDSLHGTFMRPRPPISRTLDAVDAGRCYEIPGIDDAGG